MSIEAKPHRDVLQSSIVLSTLNARYIHSSFGLRYLKANLHELQDQSQIVEFVIDVKPEDAVEKLLQRDPRIIGFGVYIWNIEQTERVVKLLKQVAPHVKIVLGGPEVSYELDASAIVSLANHVITGWGEQSFYQLCKDLLLEKPDLPSVITGVQLPLAQIEMPYQLYDDQDIAHRLIYVEASRGCPYKCEFCLSALDKTAWPFAIDRFLEQMDLLFKRGVRQFKFVDRTFNLKIKTSLQILDFFLERMDDDVFLHFEVIPDHLPDALKEKIQCFPAGSLQFEIGIQTFNARVQERISRKQKNDAAKENLRWIREQSNAYVHADLICGLPGEDLQSFADSFDTLYALRPHEIQVGILKRLKGSPIVRHTREFELVFNPSPPFNIVQNNLCNYAQIQEMNRFARYWDLIANSGRFKATLGLIIDAAPFARFMLLSKEIYARTQQTHKIALIRLFDLVYAIAIEEFALDPTQILAAIEQDHAKSGLKSLPKCLNRSVQSVKTSASSRATRQARHQN